MSKNNSLLSNLFWKFSERIAAQVVTTAVSIILARILDPSHYGVVSIVTIFITLANVFVSDGFGSALIQKKDADALDFSSVLYFNVGFSFVLYLILFFAAPYISAFYGEGYEILTPVLRVLGLRIILTGANSIQQAYVSKKMMFRKFFISTLGGTILSAIVGIIMALKGFGVWALVAQYLTNTFANTLILFIVINKRPLFAFSFNRLRKMFGFGARILGTNLMITGYMELRALIIGKLYSAKDLAFFDKGKQFPNLIVANINTSIGSVLFPKMAMEQDDSQRIKNTTRNSIRFSSYIMSPLMAGLAAISPVFVSVVLTDKWLPCVPLMQLFCITYLFQPIHTANMQAIKAIGRSDVFLKLETFKKVIELVVLVAVMWFGVDAIVMSTAILSALFTVVNAFPNRKLLGYSFKEQAADILPAILMSLIMATVVYILGTLQVNKILLLIIQVISGGVIYILLSVITKNKQFKYLKDLVKSKLF
ncbi:MAG: lipopolysaccharide biosynthesis protein [Clostridia bacterium]|nr:lipopolysaccharide biosynthesis protein [Clostridia bacterium]